MPPARTSRGKSPRKPRSRLQSSPAGLAARRAPQSLRTDQPANLRRLSPGQVYRAKPPSWSCPAHNQLQAVHPSPAAGGATGPFGPLAFQDSVIANQPSASSSPQPLPEGRTQVCPAHPPNHNATGTFAARTSGTAARRRSRPNGPSSAEHNTTHRERPRRGRDGDSARNLTSVLPEQTRAARSSEGTVFSAGSNASNLTDSPGPRSSSWCPISPDPVSCHHFAPVDEPPSRPQVPSTMTSADLAWDPWNDPLSSFGASLADRSLVGYITHLRHATCGLVQSWVHPAFSTGFAEHLAEPAELRDRYISDWWSLLAWSELEAELVTTRRRLEARVFDGIFDYALYADSPGTVMSSGKTGNLSTPVGGYSVPPSPTLNPSSDPADGFWVGAEGVSSPALAPSGAVQPQEVDVSPIMPIKIPAIMTHHGLLTPPPSPMTFKEAQSVPFEGGVSSGLLVTVESTWQHA